MGNKKRANELWKQQQELQKQLSVVTTEYNKVQEELKLERQRFLLAHVDALLELVPEHSREGCSDAEVRYADRARCQRCALLEAKRDNWWDSDLEVEVNVYYRS